MMHVELHVTLEPLGEKPEPGQWCPVCLLPSAYRLRFIVYIGETMQLRTHEYCPECHVSRWVT